MARKQSIKIKLVTKAGSSELSIVEGRLMSDGTPSPGPTEKQLAIVSKAIVDLCALEIE